MKKKDNNSGKTLAYRKTFAIYPTVLVLISGKSYFRLAFISNGFFSSKILLWVIRWLPVLIATIPLANAYKKTVLFLFDLYHEKNL